MLLAMRRRENRRKNNLDPFSGQPIVQGGLSDNPRVAAQQIERAHQQVYSHDPNRIVRRVTRGKVERRTGQNDFIVPVRNGDGWHTANIPSGTACYQVVVGRRDQQDAEDRVEYYLSHCGNPVGEIRRGRFELPGGWEFVGDSNSDQSPVVFTPPQKQEETTSRPEPEYRYSKLIVRTLLEGGVEIDGASDRFVSKIESQGDRVTVHF